MICLDPNHVGTKKNKIYYETIIKNQKLTEQRRKRDKGISDSENQKMTSTIDKDKKYQIKNQRPDTNLANREIYEELCRQNGTQVKFR